MQAEHEHLYAQCSDIRGRWEAYQRESQAIARQLKEKVARLSATNGTNQRSSSSSSSGAANTGKNAQDPSNKNNPGGSPITSPNSTNKTPSRNKATSVLPLDPQQENADLDDPETRRNLRLQQALEFTVQQVNQERAALTEQELQQEHEIQARMFAGELYAMRNQEIETIAQDMEMVQQMFQKLAVETVKQGEQVENVFANIQETEDNTEIARRELEIAEERHRKNTKVLGLIFCESLYY